MPEARLMGGGIIVIVIVAFEGKCVIQLSPLTWKTHYVIGPDNHYWVWGRGVMIIDDVERIKLAILYI